jgi:hypothetical protein
MRSMEGFPGFCAVFLGSIHPRESSDHKRERERETTIFGSRFLKIYLLGHLKWQVVLIPTLSTKIQIL